MKKRHRRADMERLLSERRAEGLTFRDLSERTGIPVPTLSYWAVKLRRERTSDEPRLVPVEVVEDGWSTPVAIEVRSGLRVLVGRDFEADHLSRVLSVLAARC
jgi:hypothetical protein